MRKSEVAFVFCCACVFALALPRSCGLGAQEPEIPSKDWNESRYSISRDDDIPREIQPHLRGREDGQMLRAVQGRFRSVTVLNNVLLQDGRYGALGFGDTCRVDLLGGRFFAASHGRWRYGRADLWTASECPSGTLFHVAIARRPWGRKDEKRVHPYRKLVDARADAIRELRRFFDPQGMMRGKDGERKEEWKR